MRVRHHHDHNLFEMDEGELNLTPYLDIITTLVIFLVFTFQVVIEFRLIEVIPPAFGVNAHKPQTPPDEKPVTVTLVITSNGYRLLTDRDDLITPAELPKRADGKYDTERLKQMAISFKQSLHLGESLILIAEDDTEYQVIVEAMDAIRMDGKNWLFPDVLLAKGAVGGRRMNTSEPPVSSEVDPYTESEAEAHFGDRQRKRRRKPVKIPGSEVSSLNMTPMMDVMTILLVFLIQSFATEPENININLALRPPESTATDAMEPAARVIVTADAILVEDKEIVKLADLDIKKGGQVEIPAVRDALLDRADHLRALEQLGGRPFDGKLLVVAHQTTPYSLITSVLFTAGQARFGEYKLVVMQRAGSGAGAAGATGAAE